MTCVSPDECVLERLSGSYFCKDHAQKYVPLYKEYKDHESRLKIKQLPTTGQELVQLYGRIEHVYNLRSKYREIAFKREFWDSGHEHRLDLLLQKMHEIEECIRHICERYAQTQMQSGTSSAASEEPNDTEDAIIQSYNHVSTMTRKIIHSEIDIWNTDIPKFILERQQYHENLQNRKDALVTLITKHVLKHLDVKDIDALGDIEKWSSYVLLIATYLNLYFVSPAAWIGRLSVTAYRRVHMRTLSEEVLKETYINLLKYPEDRLKGVMRSIATVIAECSRRNADIIYHYFAVSQSRMHRLLAMSCGDHNLGLVISPDITAKNEYFKSIRFQDDIIGMFKDISKTKRMRIEATRKRTRDLGLTNVESVVKTVNAVIRLM